MRLQNVFRVDFVVMDAQSQAVDNNRGNDYSMELLGALSEQQITERQVIALEEMEQNRVQVIKLNTKNLSSCSSSPLRPSDVYKTPF